jgi:hypothetical protein
MIQKIITLTAILVMIIFLYIYNSRRNIKIMNSNMNELNKIEVTYQKEYPIGNDYFTIKHYPDYKSFFEQFDSYKYLAYYKDNSLTRNANLSSHLLGTEFKNSLRINENLDLNLLGTCCFAKIGKYNYCADLKTLYPGNKLTYKFFRYAVLNLGLTNFFGITMKPNKTIEHLTKKYFITEYTELYLYQIKLSEITELVDSYLQKIFGEYFFIEGFKKLILKSNNSELKILHLATPNDILIKNNYNYFNRYNLLYGDYEIMFCLEKSNFNIKKLKKINIKETSKMSVYGFNNNGIKWDFIRTYMI